MSVGRTDLSEFSVGGLEPVEVYAARLRQEMINDLVSAAYLRGDFALSSGEHSSFYFDKYLFETKPTILRRLAEMLAERVPDGIDRLAGTEVGGVALVAAVSLATGVPFVIIKKIAPHMGVSSDLVRGELHASERVLLIHDVVDTGTEATESAAKVKRLGAQVAGILSVIDRQSSGPRNISSAGYHYDSLFQLSEFAV